MSEERAIPIRRWVGESIVIVGSILLAFAIDAAWEGRQERRDTLKLVESLRAEVQANHETLEEQLALDRIYRARADTVLRVVDGLVTLEASDARERMLSAVASYYPIIARTTAYEFAQRSPRWGDLPTDVQQSLAEFVAMVRLWMSDEPYYAAELDRLTVAINAHGGWRSLSTQVPGRRSVADWDAMIADPVVEQATYIIGLLFENKIGRLQRFTDDLSRIDARLAEVAGDLGGDTP